MPNSTESTAATNVSSSGAVQKLKKKLDQIEADLEEKDKALLEQETQLLQLTDDLSAS